MTKRILERPDPADVARAINRAIAEGRHSVKHQTVCQSCGQYRGRPAAVCRLRPADFLHGQARACGRPTKG